MERLWIDTVEFQNYGEWIPETQFVREVGTAYLLASKKPGVKEVFSEVKYLQIVVAMDGWDIMPELLTDWVEKQNMSITKTSHRKARILFQ